MFPFSHELFNSFYRHTFDTIHGHTYVFDHLSQVRAGENENLLEPSDSAADTLLETIRVAREINLQNNSLNNQINTDQEAQASEKAESKKADEPSSSIDELTLDSLEDEENRGKRFVFMIDKGPELNVPN